MTDCSPSAPSSEQLTKIAIIKSESKSNKLTWLSITWSLVLAWLASFIFYQGARLLGFE